MPDSECDSDCYAAQRELPQAVVFLGFRLSRKGPTDQYPYGLDRAEDLAGIGIAVVIWTTRAAPV